MLVICKLETRSFVKRVSVGSFPNSHKGTFLAGSSIIVKENKDKFGVHTNCRECPGRYGRDEGGSGGSGFVSHLISIRI